jgi:hypothetical protein
VGIHEQGEFCPTAKLYENRHPHEPQFTSLLIVEKNWVRLTPYSTQCAEGTVMDTRILCADTLMPLIAGVIILKRPGGSASFSV